MVPEPTLAAFPREHPAYLVITQRGGVTERGVSHPYLDEPLVELVEITVLLLHRPVDVVDQGVLVVGVIIALLVLLELLSLVQHGQPLGRHQDHCRQAVLLDRPAQVVVQGVVVVTLHEVGGLLRVGGPPVAGAADHGLHIAPGSAVTDELAGKLLEIVVPLGPPGVAEVALVPLVAAPVGAPGFGDEVDVLGQFVGDGVHGVFIQDGGQIKTEAIDVVLLHPVLQAVHDELAPHGGVAAVLVAAATGVPIEETRGETIVVLVVESLEIEAGTVLVALAGMVVDHVQDDGDSLAMQGVDHLFDFENLADVLGGGVVAFRGEVVGCHVTPVVDHAGRRRAVVELVDGQQFNSGDTQVLEMSQHFAGTGAVGEPHVFSPVVLGDAAAFVGGVIADVHLIENQVF